MSSLPMHRRAFGFVYDVAGLYFTKRVSRSAAELAYFLVLTFFLSSSASTPLSAP